MDKTESQAEMFANRLRKRFRHLQKWARRLHIEAFRLYDRDIPEIPLVLDVYNDIISGALYKRPYEKDEAEETLWIQAMKSVIARSLEFNIDNIIIKRRERQRGDTQYEKIHAQGIIREVREGQLKFKVNMSDYLDTGLFLDRRNLRRVIGTDSYGKKVLNIFCYTASFSVHAAAAGAVCTDSVDLSNTYLNWARDNFALNGFGVNRPRLEEYFAPIQAHNNANSHCLIRADVNIFLDKAKTARKQWDSIIIDPPAFSNSTMTHNDFDLQRDYTNMLRNCLALLSPNGKICFSASARSFKINTAELELFLAQYSPGITVTDLSSQFVDEDFKGKKTPKTLIIKKASRVVQ